MLETFVSSAIRRSLLEHILAHTNDRFYLRGLAKQLGVSVSPLRREIKRLEQAGLLRAAPEGNLLFYYVNATSPAFLQLQQVGQSPRPQEASVIAGASSALDTLPASMTPPSRAIPIGVISVAAPSHAWEASLKGPALIAVTGVGLAIMVVASGLVYVTMINRQLVFQAKKVLTTQQAAVAVAKSPSASGTMRGSRWQVVPGGFGGFSSGSSEAY